MELPPQVMQHVERVIEARRVWLSPDVYNDAPQRHAAVAVYERRREELHKALDRVIAAEAST